jgi:hypothetical protein
LHSATEDVISTHNTCAVLTERQRRNNIIQNSHKLQTESATGQSIAAHQSLP